MQNAGGEERDAVGCHCPEQGRLEERARIPLHPTLPSLSELMPGIHIRAQGLGGRGVLLAARVRRAAGRLLGEARPDNLNRGRGLRRGPCPEIPERQAGAFAPRHA